MGVGGGWVSEWAGGSSGGCVGWLGRCKEVGVCMQRGGGAWSRGACVRACVCVSVCMRWVYSSVGVGRVWLSLWLSW